MRCGVMSRVDRQRVDWPPPARIFPVLATLLLAGCGGSSERPQAVAVPGPVGEEQKIGRPYQVAGIWYYPREDANYDETGTASWYGPNFHGKPTANGESFDMNAVSAAHPTLPLPSRVRVTNLENGRALIVRVNDRGPFARGRIIDLSRRAAQLLGFARNGTARVRVQLVRDDGSIASRSDPAPRQLAQGEQPLGPLYVQVGSFTDPSNAQEVRRRLRGLDAAIEQARAFGETVYRVRIGPFADEGRARRVLDRVFEHGFYEARIFTERVS